MSKTITLKLNKCLIIEAVKADTYLTGQTDKSADAVKNASLAYNEQAGDETYQERKLIRTLRSALAKFEANMAEFVDSATGTINDTLASAAPADAGDVKKGDFNVTIVVSDRYQNGLARPLSSLAEEYIVNVMDYTWWQAIKPSLAETYHKFSLDSLTHIRLCLAKTAPEASSADYTSVTGTVTTNV